MKKLAVVVAAGIAVAALAGCTQKQIDIAATGATPVPGAGNLYRFCDGDTLIYFSNYGDGMKDEYEFIVYGGCAKDVPDQSGVQSLPDAEND